jgi:hypothetical protein
MQMPSKWGVHYTKYLLTMFAPYFYHYLTVRVIVVSLVQESMVCVVYHADALQMGPSQVHDAKY